MAILLYNPDRKNKQEFLDEFVVRHWQFDEIFNDVSTDDMKYPGQHYMLLGQRGSGKTTLLWRLKYAIEDNEYLNKWVIPIMFSEEQYFISQVVNIWEYIAEYLEDTHNFSGLSAEIQQYAHKEDFEEIALDILIKYLDRYKKKVVLLIDNVGDLLDKLDRLEIFRLREILQTRPHLRLIAASSAVLDGILDYQQPFFEFFKMVPLMGLSYDESTALLKKLAEMHGETGKIEKIIRETPSRIETLRTLSGGLPRTMALLFQVFVDDEHGNAVNDLEKILDAVTPLYKHRMDDLPAQQQKIVDAVARNWEAVSVKELTQKLRLESKVISAQLRQLERIDIIEKRTTKTKNHLYLLRERFFNIWYLMRYGRKEDRQRVIWLVRFLELWCDKGEIERRIISYVEKVKEGKLDSKSIEFYGQVYSFFEKITPETKFMVRESVPIYIAGKMRFSEKELDELFDIYLKKKDWKNFAKVALNKPVLNTAQRKSVYQIVDDLSAIHEIKWPILEFISTSKDEEVLPDSVVEVFILIVLGVYRYDVILSLIENDTEQVNKLTDLFVRLFSLLEPAIIDEQAVMFFATVIVSLLAYKYPQLALSVINRVSAVHGKSFFDKVSFCYYAALSMAENNEEAQEAMKKLGSELKEPILRLIAVIDSYKPKK